MTGEVNIMDKLGDFVKFKRKKLGLTQTEVASRISLKGISKNYISKIERKDLQGLNISTLEELLEALESDMTFLEQ